VTGMNGRLGSAMLTSVHGGRLANVTAEAWVAMVAAASKSGVSLVIAGATIAGGSGAYRDYFVQGDMKKRPWLYGLSTYSTVNIASAGYSTHGFGNALDIGSFPPERNLRAYGSDGEARREWVLAHAAEFGFTRTFGESDPNHFGHDGKARSSSSASSNTETLGGFLMALSDAEQAELLTKTRAVYDAVFTEEPTSRGSRAGLLRTVARIDDALFLDRETSFGTPGGVLVTLRKVTDHLGITTPK